MNGMDKMIADADRALHLAHTIAEDGMNRIEEEFPEQGPQNAAIITLCGYFAGIMDSILAVYPDAKGSGLYTASMKMGFMHSEVPDMLKNAKRKAS